MPADFNELIETITEFQFLERGWNSYDSKPIDYIAISNAHDVIQFLEMYIKDNAVSVDYSVFAAPTSKGGVQIDVNVENGRMLEIDIDAERDIYLQYLFDDNGKTEEGDIIDIDELDEILEMLFF